MIDVREFSGRSVEDAVAQASKHFGVESDQLDVSVLSGRMEISGAAGRVVILASIREEPPQTGPTGEFLLGVLQRMGLGGRIRIDEYESEGEIVLRVVGNRLRDLLRRDTRVQSALAHLVARAAERTREDAVVRLEMEGEDSSEAKLEELAQTKARDALSQRKEVVLPPMTSRERWIVHNALRTIAGVRTESVGEGRLKRVKIVPS